MKKIIKNVIHEIYINKNYELFTESCKKRVYDVEILADLLSKNNDITLRNFDEKDPSDAIYVEYDVYSNKNFTVEYRTIITICKIIKIFNIQHEFSINNIDPDAFLPTLDGFSGMPYTKTQADVESFVVKFFADLNYQQIEWNELNEVFGGINLPNKSIFGTQLTVENALFRDLFELTE